jgi:hypothetical protein
MAYVVYNTKTTAVVTERPFSRGSFKTKAAAKAARTRLLRKFCMNTLLYKSEDLAVAESNVYAKSIKQQVERVNLMTGKTYMEDVNTPRCCSPASEAYWSM